ncbi:MAG: cache domain-containing protein [Sulfurimonas sp.]
MKHLKTKILSILILIILGVATAVTTYDIIHAKQENDRRMVEVRKSVTLNYNQIISDTIHFYTARANSNIRSPDVLNAIRSEDHDALYRLIQPRWEVLKHENPSLIIMQFHKADGTSLLRMHQPNEYGDLIALKRSMVAHIHKHHKIISGFEEGVQGLAFRILVPIIDKGDYLGAVEFGISTAYLTEKIHQYTKYDSFFLLRKDILGTFKHINYYSPMGDYMAINVPPKFSRLLNQYKNNHHIFDNNTLKYGNQSYAISSVPIMNYLNQSIGAIVFIREIPDFWTHAVNMILATLFIALTLMIILGLMINRAYNTIATAMNFQELYSQAILDAVPSPIIVTDGNQLIAANQTFCAIFCTKTLKSFSVIINVYASILKQEIRKIS